MQLLCPNFIVLALDRRGKLSYGGQLPSKFRGVRDLVSISSLAVLQLVTMSASEALAAVKTLYDIASKVKLILLFIIILFFSQTSTKVKDNKNELFRLSQRIEHIVVTLNDCRSRDIIRSDEYNDALSAISKYDSRTFKMVKLV